MGKHTAGPWTLGTYDHASYNITGAKGEMPFVAQIPSKRPESERLANARLICAAPDLLQALEAILPIAEGAVDYQEDIDNARAAIARARGE